MSKNQEMPKGWAIVKIGDVFDFIGGGTPSKKIERYWNGNISWASVKDVKGDYLHKTEDKITKEGLKNSASNLAYPEDVILITRIIPGRTIISKITSAINQDLKIIKPRFKTSPEFIRHLFSFIERECIKLASGTTVLGISLNNLNEIFVPLPPLPEQQRIVAKIEELFSSLDQGIESLKTSQQQLKVYRQAVLQAAFSGKLTEKFRESAGDEMVTCLPAGRFEGKLTNADVKDGELPKGWKWIKLDEVVDEFVRGPFGGSLKKECFVPNGYKVYEQKNAIYQSTELGKYFINENKFKELIRFKVKPTDFIVSCSGTIGKLFMIPEQAPKGIINQALLIIRINRDLLLDKYFKYLFTSSFFQRLIINDAKGTAMLNLAGVKDMKLVPVLLPPIAEQRAIVAEIESRLSVCDKIEERIEQSLRQSESLRQSILKKAFEGKLVPQNPTDLPAPRPGKWFVYVLECDDGSYYKGYTKDILERWKQHARGMGAEWTAKHPPRKLVHWEEFSSEHAAVEREKDLKTGFGRKWLEREIKAGRTRQAGEPAIVLLERIKAEKEALIKKK